MATIGLSKVFILDKYFTELQKFWETERKVQGILKKTGLRVSFVFCFLFVFLVSGHSMTIFAVATSYALKSPAPPICSLFY